MRKLLALAGAVTCMMSAVALGGSQVANAELGVDSTGDLQARFDALKPGDTLTLDPGTYEHGGMLSVNVPGVTINGNGATLEATNPGAASFQIHADNVTLSNVNLVAPVGLPRQDGTNQTMLVFGNNGVVIRGVNITGGSSAGMYIPGASNFRIENTTVRDTASDGIQMTAGSNNGQVNNVTTERTGDDGIAVVSYTQGSVGMCHDIVVNSPVILSNNQARGLVVAGGERIAFNNINVANTSAAGVFIGSQAAFLTGSTTGVSVNGGSINAANYTAFPMGAVTVYSGTPGQIVSDVTVSGVTISNTPPTAGQNIGIAAAGGGMGNINFHDIAIQQSGDLPVLQSLDVPREAFRTTGITLNGAPYNVL